MKMFIAGLDTETNTFSPIPTGRESFELTLLAYGNATQLPLNHCSIQLATWRHLAESKDWTIAESLCAVAEPAGVTSRHVYEEFRKTIIGDLTAAMPVDCVLLALHGAMVADGYDDVEGDLLDHVRAVVGPDIPIGAELDLHAHLTGEMVHAATVLVAYKEYPHTDIAECAEQLFDLVSNAAAKKTRPVMSTFDCRMIGVFRTQEQPLRGFVDRLKQLEQREEVLSVSFIHGFPWGDVQDVGAKILVVIDGDLAYAEALAIELGEEIQSMREAISTPGLSIDEALDRALAQSKGPIVLADVSDNSGGGAPGDSTFILQRILERGIKNVVSAMYWDPIAVRFCREAGEGAVLDLRIGGKAGLSSGSPVDLKVVVRKVISGLTQRFGDVQLSIGDAVWVSANGVDLVINDLRTQVFHPDFMIALGINVSSHHIVVVKSSNHFYAGFSPIANTIYFVDAPGALQRNFDAMPLTKTNRLLWPLNKDLFENGATAKLTVGRNRAIN
jgi:microcystin degradation protein MlrC